MDTCACSGKWKDLAREGWNRPDTLCWSSYGLRILSVLIITILLIVCPSNYWYESPEGTWDFFFKCKSVTNGFIRFIDFHNSFSRNCNSFPRFKHSVNRGNELQFERRNCFFFRGNELLIYENRLQNSILQHSFWKSPYVFVTFVYQISLSFFSNPGGGERWNIW